MNADNADNADNGYDVLCKYMNKHKCLMFLLIFLFPFMMTFLIIMGTIDFLMTKPLYDVENPAIKLQGVVVDSSVIEYFATPIMKKCCNEILIDVNISMDPVFYSLVETYTSDINSIKFKCDISRQIFICEPSYDENIKLCSESYNQPRRMPNIIMIGDIYIMYGNKSRGKLVNKNPIEMIDESIKISLIEIIIGYTTLLIEILVITGLIITHNIKKIKRIKRNCANTNVINVAMAV